MPTPPVDEMLAKLQNAGLALRAILSRCPPFQNRSNRAVKTETACFRKREKP